MKQNKTKIKNLVMGVDAPRVSTDEKTRRVNELRATIEHYLPGMVKAIKDLKSGKVDAEAIVQHQDAFAAGYDDDEYMILGMAVKYAGLHGVKIMVIGTNHETF